MNSSGIKRGLAATAVSALAIAGLPLLASSASANPISAQSGENAVTLASQFSGQASTKNDGVNTSVHLVAGGGKNVTKVAFSYTVGGGAAQPIETVSREANGAFSHDWTPPGNVLGATVTITATGQNAAGENLSGAASRTVVVGAGSEAVDISNAPGSEIGVFERPYAGGTGFGGVGSLVGIVSGTTSASSVETGVPGSTSATNTKMESATAGVREFAGTFALDGYDWQDATATAPAVNQALVAAQAGSDDVEAVSLYKQEIRNVAVSGVTKVPAGSPATDAVVTVTDQRGLPIAGARVVQEGAAGEKFTGADGKATFSVSAGTSAFYVDTTGAAGYDSATDFRKTFTVSTYAAEVKTLAVARKAAAYDRDVVPADAVTVSAKDQEGAPIAPGTILGTWTVKPFDGTAEQTVPATFTVAGGNATAAVPTGAKDGVYTLNVYKEQDGTPGSSDGDLRADAISIRVGQATVKWGTANKHVQAAAGTTTDQTGVLQLADGTPLAGVAVTLTYTQGDGASDKAVFATTQPTGVTRSSDTSATTTTGADGSFTVRIADKAPVAPATSVADEPNGELLATAPGVADAEPLTLDFVDLGAANIAFDAEELLIDAAVGKVTPGRPYAQTLTVTNKGGSVLKNTAVKLSLDHGFFTEVKSGAPVPAATPTAGAEYGVWKNDGATKEVVTDANGEVTVYVAIARDAGFDDDGKVDIKMSATAGTKTVVDPTAVRAESVNALNLKDIKVEFADKQDSVALPKAELADSVWLDVIATDQFGNRTRTDVALSDGTHAGTFTTITESLFTGDDKVEVKSGSSATDQVITAQASGVVSNLWIDGTPATPAFDAARDANKAVASQPSASRTIEWYAYDLADERSTITLTHDGGEEIAVGATVVVTYKVVDQFGNVVPGRNVQFFRSGPDPLQDGSAATTVETNANGIARYVFQGTAAGLAEITAYTLEGAKDSSPIVETKRELDIQFGQIVEPEAPIVFADLDFAITGDETVLPNGLVTKSVTVKDEDGAGVSGLSVEFTVAGKSVTRTTGPNGVASYTFNAPAEEGTYDVIAVVTDGGIQSETLTSVVTVDDGVEPEEPDAPIDFADLDFAITEAGEPVDGGSIVTRTVTVTDADGAGVAGLTVEFTVLGEKVERVTNAQGVASYTFEAPTAAGTYNVIARVSDGDVQSETLTSAVTVKENVVTPPPIPTITATLTGANNAKKADKLTVKADNKIAAGAIVKLFKFNAKGKRVLVDTDVLNANGARVFTVTDNNKAKKTKYVAVIVGSKSVHSKATSNTKAVR